MIYAKIWVAMYYHIEAPKSMAVEGRMIFGQYFLTIKKTADTREFKIGGRRCNWRRKNNMANVFRLVLLSLAASIVLAACPTPSGGGKPNTSPPPTEHERESFTADGVVFDMIHVSGGHTFPIIYRDSDLATLSGSYWIGETEVTYELWYAVHDWALDNNYFFANPGCEGSEGAVVDPEGAPPTEAMFQPVTKVNWRDCLVWCNALTEWYNAKTESIYTCVYLHAGEPIRDSRENGTGHEQSGDICDAAKPDPTATGFRLLSASEWEMAARWRGSDTTNTVHNTIKGVDFANPEDGLFWTKGNSASGARSEVDPADMTETLRFAVWGTGCTSAVKSLGAGSANGLGLYDMSGNVSEWCRAVAPPAVGMQGLAGGNFDYNQSYLQLGWQDSEATKTASGFFGFRLAMSAF
jgi:sulfatase modifying factor 1